METTQSYDPVYGRIESIHAAKAGFVIEDQTYAFDVLGNLRERHDNRAGVDEYFCYDTLNRLVDNGLSSCSGTGSTHLTYDLHGNLLSKTGIGNYTYSGAGTAGPHAVTQAGGNTYHYDANGNLTSVSGTTPRTVSYTPFGKPALITGGGHSVAVIYGPNQHRVRRIDNSSVATTYVGGLYEHVGERQRIYLHDFAVLETGTGGAGLTYLHRDHLGSIVAKSDTTATNDDHVEWLAYAAWGKRLDESWAGNELGPTDQPNATTRGFTGHEHLDPVGLIHMNGRVYDPAIGRFLSADPLVQAPFNTQSYNRYSYVFNNPLSFTDPSGFACTRGEEGQCLDEIVVKAERSCSAGATCMSGEQLRGWGGWIPVMAGSLAPMFFGTDADCVLRNFLIERDGDYWSGNHTWNGLFGKLRPDLLYDANGGLQVFEVKPEGSEARAVAQLNGYLTKSQKDSLARTRAGDLQLIFRGGSSVTLRGGWFKQTTYTYRNTGIPGVVTYTVDKPDLARKFQQAIERNNNRVPSLPWWARWPIPIP